MKRKSILPILVLQICISSLTFDSLTAQRTGNIVEYFGKEKVNEIHEGEVLHIFEEALFLHFPSIGFESSSFPLDPVFDRFLMSLEDVINVGDAFDVDNDGNQLRWESIAVDSTSTFADGGLRSSYLYLSYESKGEEIALFEASGHTVVSINGLPHEGDHYDFGWSLIPFPMCILRH